MKRILKLLPILFICVILTSCAGVVKKQEAAGTATGGTKTVVVAEDPEVLLEEDIRAMVEDEGPISATAQMPSSPKELEKKADEVGKLYMVHFDFDKYMIKDEYKGRLRENAKWLRNNSGTKVVIEGHADERGENEYNLALGDKRATSVKRYLKALGVRTSNLSTISYGEEKPLNEEHNDVAWAKNRRAEFHISN